MSQRHLHHHSMLVIRHGTETIILCNSAATARLSGLHRNHRGLKRRLGPASSQLRWALINDHVALQHLRHSWHEFGLHGHISALSDKVIISTVVNAVAQERLFAISASARPAVTSASVDMNLIRSRAAAAELRLGLPDDASGKNVAGWSARAKIGAMIKHVPSYLTGNILAAFNSLFAGEALELLILSLVGLAIAQWYGVGELADAGLVAWAWWTAGRAGLVALGDLLESFIVALKAQNDADIARAAALCAGALVVLGVSVLTLMATRAGRKPAAGKSVSAELAEMEPPGASRPGIARSTAGEDARQAAAQKAFEKAKPSDVEAGTSATGPRPAAQGSVRIDEARVNHIFRDAPGHLPDTSANRQLLEGVANDEGSTLGNDRYGNTWSAKTLPDGTQVWTQARNGQIINGGVNEAPRAFNSETGLSALAKPGSR